MPIYPIYGMVEEARRAWMNWSGEDCCQEANRNGEQACAEHMPLFTKYQSLCNEAAEGPEWDHDLER